MIRGLLAFLSLLTASSFGLPVGSAFAQCTVPNNLTNGTTADATQVMGNFNAVLGCVNNGQAYQYFLITTSNSAWNIAANFGHTPTELFIEAWGGGGSGSGHNNSQRGTGGGGGQYFFHHYTGTMDTTLSITIGPGGATITGSTGNSGGNTIVSGTNLGTLTAHGGAGGPFAPNGGGGGAGTTNALFQLDGGDGTSQQDSSSAADFGVGGDSPRGGQGGRANVAAPGKVPGGGGSGENNTGGGSGAGAQGWVLIWGK